MGTFSDEDFALSALLRLTNGWKKKTYGNEKRKKKGKKVGEEKEFDNKKNKVIKKKNQLSQKH